MRVDKVLTGMGIATRTEASKVARKGGLLVNSEVCTDTGKHVDPEKDIITFLGEKVSYSEFSYVMLNKPTGYISATDDPREKDRTVLELLPERLRRLGLFPCGRLDKDTVGLLILTNNGELAHRLLSPKHHAEKVYFFRAAEKVDFLERLKSGVELDGGYVTLPAGLELIGEREGYITLTEGKYHQIKRMFESVGNKITFLERVKFGGIPLDTRLGRGKWRMLEDEEIKLLTEENI